MNIESDTYDKEISITLLSNGSSNLFKENSLTSFSNKLHTPIILNPSDYHYVALQEIGLSLNSGNIKIPNQKPAIIYFEWNTSFSNNLEKITNYETLKQVFIETYEQNKNSFFINYPNKFGIYSDKGHIENKVYTTDTIEQELRKFDFFSNEEFFEGKLQLRLVKNYIKDTNDLWWQRFEIKRQNSNPSETAIDKNKEIGLLIHRNLAKALQLSTHLKDNFVLHSSRFEKPTTLEIDSETYLLYFIRESEIVFGGIFHDNKIQSNDDTVINIDSNIVDPYISDTKFCNTLATFNNVTNNQNFFHYYPNSRTFYKLRGNEIDTINIRISDKDYNQLSLFQGIPTIVKLIIRSKVTMDFTSNLRVSSKAPGTLQFQNKNSSFRVVLPSNDIFQSENSQLSISSITYPNQFKVLPKYLKSDKIRKIFLYSDQKVDEFNMNFFTEDDPELTEDIANAVSLDPNVLISNFNKKFKKEKIEWVYDKLNQRISLRTKQNAYLLQIPIQLGKILGLQESDVNYSNQMATSHLFRPLWFYKAFLTEKLVDVMKIQNDLSIYELLGNNDFPVEDFFYIGLSSNDVFQFQQSIDLQLHRPRYALVYNNIIEDSIVDNSYYKILKTIYFEDSESKWKTITYKNDEFKKIQEKNPLYLEFSLRLPSGDLVEFENDEDDVVVNLKTKIQ